MVQPEARSQSRLLTLGTTVLVVAALYLAQEFLIPVAMAMLFSFLLAPLVRRLQRLGLGRIPSVLAVVVVTLLGTGVLGFVVAQQLLDLGGQIPRYQKNIIAKLDALNHSIAPALKKANQTVAQVEEHLQPSTQTVGEGGDQTSKPGERVEKSPGESQARAPSGDEDQTAVPVKVVSTPMSVPSIFSNVLGPALAPLSSVAVVAVLVIFTLIQREDLRNRIIRLVGDTQLRITTQALDDASTRVSHYLLMQLIINASYGVAIAIGLHLIGLPNATLWGLLACLLRFVPYVGPIIGGAMPLLLSLAVFEGWTRPFLVLGWIVLLELLSNNVLEPWLYSAGTGVSPLGIIVSAVFWTWLWGGVGLVLSTPVTVCLTVLGRHVPQLRFLSVLLGDEPPLSPHASFYQRLLALDQDEAEDQAREFLTTRTATEFFDEVLVPALGLAEQDRHNGELDESRTLLMHAAIREIIDDVVQQGDNPTASQVPADETGPINSFVAICVPANDPADELVGVILGQLLANRGIVTEIIPRETITSSQFDVARIKAAAVVWISALPPVADIHARDLYKRLRARTSTTKIMVGLWTGSDSNRAKDQLQRAGAAEIVASLQGAVDKTIALLSPVIDGNEPEGISHETNKNERTAPRPIDELQSAATIAVSSARED